MGTEATNAWASYVRWGSKSDLRMFLAISGICVAGVTVLVGVIGAFTCLIGMVCR